MHHHVTIRYYFLSVTISQKGEMCRVALHNLLLLFMQGAALKRYDGWKRNKNRYRLNTLFERQTFGLLVVCFSDNTATNLEETVFNPQ